MLGPSPMHIKYTSYVYDGFCIWRTNFPGPIESVISKFTCTTTTTTMNNNDDDDNIIIIMMIIMIIIIIITIIIIIIIIVIIIIIIIITIITEHSLEGYGRVIHSSQTPRTPVVRKRGFRTKHLWHWTRKISPAFGSCYFNDYHKNQSWHFTLCRR